MSLFLAALAMAQAPAIAAEPYRAQGSDPSWSVTIASGRLTYEPAGGQPISINAPRSTSEQGMTRYAADGLEVVILPMPCTDKASGRRFTDTVIVEARGEERGGCGGAELPADSLSGTSWHFAEIGGESTGLTGDLLRDDIYAIDFVADAFVGYDGCNRFAGSYSQADGILKVTVKGGTAGDCREPMRGRERRLLEILEQPLRIAFPDPKTMVLTGEKGSIMLLRAEEEE